MYENWKILKSEADEKAEEYSAVANWCNENGQYTIEEQGEYFAVVEIPEPTEEEKATAIRAMRDNYLKEYVDEYVTNPLRWHDMSEEQQEEIKNYRRYLLDIPEQKEFPNIEVMTFDEWKKNNVYNQTNEVYNESLTL